MGPVPFDGYLSFQSFLQVDGDRKVGRLFYRRNGCVKPSGSMGFHTRPPGRGWQYATTRRDARSAPWPAATTSTWAVGYGVGWRALVVHHPLRLAPGETAEGVSFFAVAADLDEALRYAGLTDAGVL